MLRNKLWLCFCLTSDFLISTFPGLSPAQEAPCPAPRPASDCLWPQLIKFCSNKCGAPGPSHTGQWPVATLATLPHCRWLCWSVLVTTFTVSQSFLNPFIVQLFLYSIPHSWHFKTMDPRSQGEMFQCNIISCILFTCYIFTFYIFFIVRCHVIMWPPTSQRGR